MPARTFTCVEVFDQFLEHAEARVAREDLPPSTLASYRQILNHTWRPRIGRMSFLSVRYSTLARIVDAQTHRKKTYDNVVSVIKRVFEFGYRDHPEQRNPAAFLKCARIRRSDRPVIDPFTIEEAEVLVAALHHDWGEAKNPYRRWRRTLMRLSIRYRRPYVARHCSVSWNLMIDRNPVWLAAAAWS